MRQVVNRTDAGRQASAEPTPFPQTPHPRFTLSEVEGATQALTCGINFPINDVPPQRNFVFSVELWKYGQGHFRHTL
jgi:hypothetical protein